MTIVFEWNGSIPDHGSVLWSVTAVNSDSDTVRQFGYKIVDGETSAHFVFDFNAVRQDNHPEDVDLTEGRLEARFPRSVIAALGDEWTWEAALCIDGTDVSVYNR